MRAIASPSNPRFREWLKLATTPRHARATQRALVEGLHAIDAARAAGRPLAALIVRKGTSSPAALGVAEAIAAGGTPVFELAAALYDRLSPVEHGAGLVAEIAWQSPPRPRRARADMLYLDGVQDPGNAGALLRVAAAAGVGIVCARRTTAALWSPKVLRAAQGAHFRLALHEDVEPDELESLLDGTWIAADAHGATPLWRFEFPPGAIGWVVGAEGTGLAPETRAACRARVTIPVESAVESLNVASAAAVCLFERRRRLYGG